MAEAVKVPKLGLTMENAKVTKLCKKEGEVVKADEPLFEIETDKISSQVESPVNGYLLRTLVEEDTVVDVLETVCIVGEKNENIDHLIGNDKSITENKGAQKANLVGTKVNNDKSSKRVLATPIARKKAKENEIDLTKISGSGPNGRITKKDVLKLITDKKKAIDSKQKKVPLTGIKKKTAEKMFESKKEIPHTYFKTSVDTSNMIELRKQNNGKISYNAIIIENVAEVLAKYPDVNVSLHNNEIIYKKSINIGLAVNTSEGLIVPVVKDANKKNVREIQNETSSLINKARKSNLKLQDLEKATFTISNLGMYKVDEFSAIINMPESAILAIGRIIKKPVVIDDNIEIRPLMNITLSVDHRVIDGVLAAEFLQDIKTEIESISLDK